MNIAAHFKLNSSHVWSQLLLYSSPITWYCIEHWSDWDKTMQCWDIIDFITALHFKLIKLFALQWPVITGRRKSQYYIPMCSTNCISPFRIDKVNSPIFTAIFIKIHCITKRPKLLMLWKQCTHDKIESIFCSTIWYSIPHLCQTSLFKYDMHFWGWF